MTYGEDLYNEFAREAVRRRDPRCAECGTQLESIDAACPNCLPGFYAAPQVESVRHIHRLLTPDEPAHPLILSADHGRDWHGWSDCGVVAPPDTPCTAWSVAGKNQCPKRAAVILDLGDDVPLTVAVCGGHLEVHRRRALRVEWT